MLNGRSQSIHRSPFEERKDRKPSKAVDYLTRSCEANHAPSCYNLAVMFKKGDEGVPPDEKRFEEYKAITHKLIAQFGGLSTRKTG
jgi:cytochrome c oxidase assembly factor 7